MLLETESPFMIPAQVKEKKRSMPEYIVYTAKFLAEMLDSPLEEIAEQVWKNSCRIFRLPE